MAVINLANESPARKCPNGIINEYLEYCDGQECPSDYHLWCIIGVIGMAMGRGVWVDRFFNKIFPNLYIILIGESALVHKSTALAMAIAPFREALPDLAVITKGITPQKLASMFAEIYKDNGETNSELLIHASELSLLLGKVKLDDAMLKALTDYWDCPKDNDYSTIMRGTEVAKNLFLTLLGATTPDWLRNTLPMDSMEGGFLSRLVLVSR